MKAELRGKVRFFQKRTIIDRDMPPAVLLHDTLIQKIKCWLNDGAPDN